MVYILSFFKILSYNIVATKRSNDSISTKTTSESTGDSCQWSSVYYSRKLRSSNTRGSLNSFSIFFSLLFFVYKKIHFFRRKRKKTNISNDEYILYLFYSISFAKFLLYFSKFLKNYLFFIIVCIHSLLFIFSFFICFSYY